MNRSDIRFQENCRQRSPRKWPIVNRLLKKLGSRYKPGFSSLYEIYHIFNLSASMSASASSYLNSFISPVFRSQNPSTFRKVGYIFPIGDFVIRILLIMRNSYCCFQFNYMFYYTIDLPQPQQYICDTINIW